MQRESVGLVGRHVTGLGPTELDDGVADGDEP